MAYFKKLKRQIGIAQVLEHYGLMEKLKKQAKPGQFRSVCPIHGGANPTSFSVNINTNEFQCFSCKEHGGILGFVIVMEGIEGANDDKKKDQARQLLKHWFGSDVRVAGSWIQKKKGGNGQKTSKNKPLIDNVNHEGGAPIRAADTVKNDEGLKTEQGEINKPLTFSLRNLNASHPYLLSRVKPETVERFELGFCQKGMMAGRVVMPIHNEAGQLIAYAGRAVDEETENEKGKYKLPPEFKKGHVLFNLHRVIEAVKQGAPLIVVEGFFDVFRLYELGCHNAVAIMGSALTVEQEVLLKTLFNGSARVVLMFDSDQAGHACRQDVAGRLAKLFFIKVVALPEGVGQPDQLKEKIYFL